LTATAKSFGALTWTNHADDWRGRLVGEHLTPLRGPAALRPLGRVVPGLRTDALPGVTLEPDSHGGNHFMLRYRLSY
jgi:hypothetical protein